MCKLHSCVIYTHVVRLLVIVPQQKETDHTHQIFNSKCELFIHMSYVLRVILFHMSEVYTRAQNILNMRILWL